VTLVCHGYFVSSFFQSRRKVHDAERRFSEDIMLLSLRIGGLLSSVGELGGRGGKEAFIAYENEGCFQGFDLSKRSYR